ncbi:protein MAINTENANCE OF MERISTEMS-like [Amaranthus tricolor]|uniref:protein MAINTENANCE OF MERISTEMS-like n=1 Tax=Amaranthus tricolor TaxID=29722 RepID=UPI00258C1049|nr:protein MAINTENANCE OF MERISTEMS-like [Amaranthus tricolor]
MEIQSTTYYMAIVSSTLLADETKTGMRPHPILTVNVDQDENVWGAVTLVYMYRQLGMTSRVGCKTIAGCRTLLQTWIYEYFPAFHPHPRQADVPNNTRAEMWSTPKPGRLINRPRDCRSILDSMTDAQVYLSERKVQQLGYVQAIPPAPIRPTQALRPAHGTYSVTFASPLIYTEAWSRFSIVAALFLNEWSSRVAPLMRLPPVPKMSP